MHIQERWFYSFHLSFSSVEFFQRKSKNEVLLEDMMPRWDLFMLDLRLLQVIAAVELW